MTIKDISNRFFSLLKPKTLADYIGATIIGWLFIGPIIGNFIALFKIQLNPTVDTVLNSGVMMIVALSEIIFPSLDGLSSVVGILFVFAGFLLLITLLVTIINALFYKTFSLFVPFTIFVSILLLWGSSSFVSNIRFERRSQDLKANNQDIKNASVLVDDCKISNYSPQNDTDNEYRINCNIIMANLPNTLSENISKNKTHANISFSSIEYELPLDVKRDLEESAKLKNVSLDFYSEWLYRFDKISAFFDNPFLGKQIKFIGKNSIQIDFSISVPFYISPESVYISKIDFPLENPYKLDDIKIYLIQADNSIEQSWQKYENKNYNFVMYYPPSWSTGSIGETVIFTPEPSSLIGFQIEQIFLSFRENFNQQTSMEYFNEYVLPSQKDSPCSNFRFNEKVPVSLSQYDITIVTGLCGMLEPGPMAIIANEDSIITISSGMQEKITEDTVYEILERIELN